MSYYNDKSNCIVVNEASSTQTSVFIFIKDNPSLNFKKIFSYSFYSLKLDKYVNNHDYQGFYNQVFSQEEVRYFLIDSKCTTFHWLLLATGGMRNYELHNGALKANEFYKNFTENFLTQICTNNQCKKLVLHQARTITGEEEGYFAWKTYNSSSNCHSVLDLGGETYQISTSTNIQSYFLGKEKAISILESKSDQCYAPLYHGEMCRSNIKQYLSENFNLQTQSPFLQNQCLTVGISNFYHYFTDVCNSYLPLMQSLKNKDNNEELSRIEETCLSKKNDMLTPILVQDYKVFSDLLCHHWDHDWNGKKASYLKHACFTANYNYQLLRLFEMEDNDTVHISQNGWEYGAVTHFFEENELILQVAANY